MEIGNTASSSGDFLQVGGSIDCKAIRVGISGSGLFEIRDGAIDARHSIIIGAMNGGKGSLTQKGGIVSIPAVTIGSVAGAEVSYTMEGGTLEIAGATDVGVSGRGQFTQEGGVVKTGRNVFIGHNSGSEGIYNLYGGELVCSNANNNYKDVIVGTQGALGTLNLGDANGRGQVTDAMVNNKALRLVIGAGGAECAGTVRGWGSYPFHQIYNNGRVIADGYGSDRDLQLADLNRSVFVSDQNGGSNGWFAVNGGRLRLPALAVNANASIWWGESADTAHTEYMVNSLRLSDVSTAATLTGSLLAIDRGDVPAGLFKPLSVWEFEGTDCSANVMARYDDKAVQDVSSLRIFQYMDDRWVARPTSIDAAKKTISADLESPLGIFAVSTTESGTAVIVR